MPAPDPNQVGSSLQAFTGLLVFAGLMAIAGWGLTLPLRRVLNRRCLVRRQAPLGQRANIVVALGGAISLYLGLPFVAGLRAQLRHDVLPRTGLTWRDIKPVIDRHCKSCHSEHPANGAFAAPPMGLQLTSYDDVRSAANQVRMLTVETHLMPYGNTTGMTGRERSRLGEWIAAGEPR